MRDERPRDIWDQHEALLGAVIAGDAKTAEKLARQHIEQAADFMIKRLGSGIKRLTQPNRSRAGRAAGHCPVPRRRGRRWATGPSVC